MITDVFQESQIRVPTKTGTLERLCRHSLNDLENKMKKHCCQRTTVFCFTRIFFKNQLSTILRCAL